GGRLAVPRVSKSLRLRSASARREDPRGGRQPSELEAAAGFIHYGVRRRADACRDLHTSIGPPSLSGAHLFSRNRCRPAAIEPRLRTGVLLSGGFETWTIPPEVDPLNFASRVKQPVLMVNGRDDFDLPYASAQVPLFNMLGTPAADKRHAVLEGGHIPPKP